MASDLRHGDCLDLMKDIPDGSIDMVMADPPYGTTECKWDSIIPLGPMWEALKRVTKPNGAIVLMAAQPFTTKLISFNMKMFKYCWVWEKSRPSGFLNAKKRPLNSVEDIVIFFDILGTYNPQGTRPGKLSGGRNTYSECYEFCVRKDHIQTTTGYPRSVLRIKNSNSGNDHPTQKPVALMEYLIKTYTNEGETVLDFCMGSGTTGVAARNLDRKFYGIEKEKKYFDIASKRIEDARTLFTR